MYRCELCTTLVPAHTPARRRVLATRSRSYPYRSKVIERVDPSTGKRKKFDDPGGEGREIVREALVCSACVT